MQQIQELKYGGQFKMDAKIHKDDDFIWEWFCWKS